MTKSLTDMLKDWIELDSQLEAAKKHKREVVAKADSAIAKLEAERDMLIEQVDAEMKANGVFEDLIEGKMHNYKITYQQQPERVIVDDDAVPDDMCKIERKPRLAEIKAMLAEGKQVNWARLERNEPKLVWRMVKK
jgi:translation elongation factor EF-Ts